MNYFDTNQKYLFDIEILDTVDFVFKNNKVSMDMFRQKLVICSRWEANVYFLTVLKLSPGKAYSFGGRNSKPVFLHDEATLFTNVSDKILV